MVCGLKVSHPRQRQSEITLSMQLSNEARDAVTLKNKRTLELWGSTFVFEKVMRRGGKNPVVKMKGTVCFHAAARGVCFIWSWTIIHSIQSACGLLIYYKCNFPSVLTLWFNQGMRMWFWYCHINKTLIWKANRLPTDRCTQGVFMGILTSAFEQTTALLTM